MTIASPANGLALAVAELSLALAAHGVTGALSASDWDAFNGKQPALGFTPLNKAGDSMTGANVLVLTGSGYDPALKFVQNHYAQDILNVYDDTNALVFKIQPLRSTVTLLTASGATLKLDAGNVDVVHNLRVFGDIQPSNNVGLGLYAYATSGNPLTTSPSLDFRTFAWNGSDGYSILSLLHFRLTKDDNSQGHGTLHISMEGYGVGDHDILTVDHSGKVTAFGVLMPVQALTASAPAYVKGGIYFDTTLNKLRVGGATGWETITSV